MSAPTVTVADRGSQEPFADDPPPADRLPRLLPAAAGAAGLADHLRRHGAPPYRGGPELLLPTVAAAGLTGRGGAAFPMATKLRAVAAAGSRAVVVGNGAEGEPASVKDATLLWSAPHLVLDGLQLAAEAVRARRGYLYLAADPERLDRLRAALAERADRRLDRVPVELVAVAPRFVAGQETAVVARVEGRPALPRFAVEPVYRRGVDGRPTLVSNVETLAHLALLARYGARWFRALGTPAEPGSALLSVQEATGRRRVLEAALGTPLQRLLDFRTAPVGAVLAGGYHGGWVPGAVAESLGWTNADLAPRGGSVGAGVLVALPADRCGLVESARVLRYLATESAGQCGPCLNGLPRIAAAMTELAEGRAASGVLTDLHRWAGLVTGRGACRHPDGSVRFLRSALTTFADEVALHQRRRCTATDRRPFLPLPAGAAGRPGPGRLR